MKLKITITPEGGKNDSGVVFDVELSKKHFDLAKHSVTLASSIKNAIENIREDLNKEG